MKKKFVYLLFLIVFCCFVVSTKVQAQDLSSNSTNLEELTVSKKTIKDNDKAGEYDVNVSIPGKDSEFIEGYNVVIVIDGSYSTDSTWKEMRKAVIDTLDVLLPSTTPSKNVNRVALISFGMASHVNIELTNDKSVFLDTSKFPSDEGGSLLFPGRSSTNTEVGFKGAREYLENLSSDLKKDKEHTVIIYLSDGKVNMNETEYNFYQLASDSTTSYHKNFKNVILSAICSYDEIIKVSGYENTYAHDIIRSSISKIKELYNTYYSVDDTLTLEDKINKLEKEHQTEFNNFVSSLIDDLYSVIGYKKDKSYSAGDYEKLINGVLFGDRNVYFHYEKDANIEGKYNIVVGKSVVYDAKGNAINQSLNSTLEDAFYYPIFVAINSKEESITRAIAAGNKIKEDGLASTIYTIGFGNSTARGQRILNPDYSANQGINHYSDGYRDADSVDDIAGIFKDFVYSIVKVKAKNTVFVDYTSKWVNPVDIDGDGKFTNKDVVVKNGNMEIENALVSVEEVTDVLDNKSGKIYKITWEVNEQINPWDQYTLSYRVKVDTLEEGFESSKEYHANDEVTLTYDIVTVKDGEETIIETDVKGKVDIDDSVSQKVSTSSGRVIVHYVDEDGKNLHDDVILIGDVNSSYETECLDFENYVLLRVDRDTAGKYVDGDIHVTYVYTDNIGDTDYEDEILPPHTDTKSNSHIYILAFQLFCILMIKKYGFKKI